MREICSKCMLGISGKCDMAMASDTCPKFRSVLDVWFASYHWAKQSRLFWGAKRRHKKL